MSDDNVKEVKFTSDQAKADLEKLKRDMPEMIATQRELAKLVRAKYLSLIESGFSAAESLELSKKLEW